MTLRAQAFRGVRWTAFSAATTAALQTLQTIVLARLLTPDDFGLMAMVMVVVSFAQSFADAGIGKAIIHRQDSTRDQLASLYWLTWLSGVLSFLMIILLGPAIVSFFKEPRLRELIFLGGLNFLIVPIGQQHQILLQRDLRFRELAIAEVVGVASRGVVAIVCAWFGAGASSFMYGLLAASGARSAVLAAVGWPRWPPRLHFRFRDLRGYIGFGVYQMGDRILNMVKLSVDTVLIGRLLGSEALGLYRLAFDLVVKPVYRINPILTRVAFPVFAKIQRSSGRLNMAYLSLVGVICTVNSPILLGLMAVASPTVSLLLGPDWLPVVPLLRILCVYALLRSIGNPVGSLLLARGRADLGFHWTLATTVVFAVSVYIGIRTLGLVGAAYASALLMLLLLPLSYVILIRPLIGPCGRLLIRAAAVPLALAMTMAVAVMGLGKLVESVPTSVGLVIQVVGGVMVYVLLTVVFNRSVVRFGHEFVFGS